MVLQGVEFPIFLLILARALQQCSASALPVIVLVLVFSSVTQTCTFTLFNVIKRRYTQRLIVLNI